MHHLNETQTAKVIGHICIQDPETGEVFVDKRNAINFENMSIALAYSLAGLTVGNEYTLFQMAFGNGGVIYNGTGSLTYRATNTSDIDGELHNETYTKSIANTPSADPDNNILVDHTAGNNYSDIVITATLDYSEPTDQDELDNAASEDGSYVFDELGLKLATGIFISHVIFHPVQKSANRKIQVVYTIRITAGS
jgi:hypothetical protein